MAAQLQTPVALFIFKRPDTTQKVFETIRAVKPVELLLVADGPRPEREGEREKCLDTRAVVSQIDWDCKVLRNYSDINLGCGKRVSSGLDWVFEQVDEAIILEDDCVPDQSFFQFCEELLALYREDERIFSISGQNIQLRSPIKDSYYFSRYPHCWGWATWRRAWQHYDFDMQLWPQAKESRLLDDILLDSGIVNHWTKIFQAMYEKQIDTWDFQWTFACWLQSSLNIHAGVNLVSNIGFGAEATHTIQDITEFSQIARQKINFPLKHPSFLVRNSKADHYTQTTLYYQPLLKRIQSRLKRLAMAGRN